MKKWEKIKGSRKLKKQSSKVWKLRPNYCVYIQQVRGEKRKSLLSHQSIDGEHGPYEVYKHLHECETKLSHHLIQHWIDRELKSSRWISHVWIGLRSTSPRTVAATSFGPSCYIRMSFGISWSLLNFAKAASSCTSCWALAYNFMFWN